LLLPGSAMLAFFGQCGWEIRSAGLLATFVMIPLGAVVVSVLAGVCWLKQHVVYSELEPQRQESQALVASPKDA
jgi:hypothetical protein